MKRRLDDLEPGAFRLREPIWKFDSLVLDAGTLLGRRELEKLQAWGITRVDVAPAAPAAETEPGGTRLDITLPAIAPEPWREIPGVTDAVPAEAVARLAAADLGRLSTIEELERIDFDLEPDRCQPNPHLYLPDAVSLPDGYGAGEIGRSNADLVAFARECHDRAAEGLEPDHGRLKLLATLKVEELKRTGAARLLASREALAEADGADYLAPHAVGVALLSLATGERLGYGVAWLAELAVAALLHDIGMARVPRDAWHTPRRFRFDDYFGIFKHPILGVDHLTRTLRSRLGGLVSLAVYQHHERLDGSGYPKGRKGIGICEYARILGACDAYDAMTSDRPHRRRIDPVEAFRHLAENTGSLFDRRVVDALHRALVETGSLPDSPAPEGVEGARPVVIADPSPYNLWYICQLLRNNRVPVFAARSEEDLTRAARELSPRVVIVDAAINGQKGLDILGAFGRGEATRSIPLIYTSTSGDKIDVMHAIRLGVRDYLKKPYTFDFAVNRLTRFL